MSIKITFKTNISEKIIKNYVLFSDENFRIKGFNQLPLSKHSNFIGKIVDNNSSKEKDFISFNINPSQKIILIKLKKNTSIDNEKIGAKFFNYLKTNSTINSSFLENNFKELISKNKNFLDEFLHGIQLKSYEFNKYKTKKKE